MDLTRQVEGAGFSDVEEGDILELVMPGTQPLSAEDAEDMLHLANQEKSSVPKDEDNDFEKQFHSKSLIKIINFLQSTIDEALSQDPVMTRSMHFKRSCNLAIQIYEDLYKDYMRKIKQTKITDFISKKTG